ncbi:hypothetical protein P886_0451 [Alteromonadaceae bacterium 2753L.S.0a.02]|nr:hypothetical protein P886_0451 [Alteromonadaceae bacterium 2753L.S.0a.02]
MCWSGEASAVVAVTGLASTAYFYKKGESRPLCYALLYFSLMELLQAYTYSVIDQCFDTRNTVATYLGYIHIAFQPVFINLVSLYFVPQPVRRRLFVPVMLLALLGSLMFLVRILPIEWSRYCYEMTYYLAFFKELSFKLPFCGEQTCSTSGAWHIAWATPAAGNLILSNAYVIVAFALPLLYGAWRMTIYHIITGPLLAALTTSDPNEWAAVWCLYSIGLLLLLIKTPIRTYIYETKFYGFDYPRWMTKSASRNR